MSIGHEFGETIDACLALRFREREPNDREVVPHIAESVAFWAPHVDSGALDLRV